MDAASESDARLPGGLLVEYGLVVGSLLVAVAVLAALFGLRALDPFVVRAPLVFLVGVAGFLVLGAWSARFLAVDLPREDVVGFALGTFVVPVAGAVLLARAVETNAFATPGTWAATLFGIAVAVAFVGYLQGRLDRLVRRGALAEA